MQSWKPNYIEVHRDYMDFVSGVKLLVNQETGEVYNPRDYEPISESTVRAYWASRLANGRAKNPFIRLSYLYLKILKKPLYFSLADFPQRQTLQKEINCLLSVWFLLGCSSSDFPLLPPQAYSLRSSLIAQRCCGNNQK